MPINTDSPASSAAREEAELWAEIAGWPPAGWTDIAPTESAVVGFFDPARDLTKRASSWNHDFSDHRLSSLASFGAGLASAEAEAWEADEPHVATRAFADRRFLLGDRVVHWAVPWLDAAGRCYPAHGEDAHRRRRLLLAIGDRLRPAPDLGPVEGLTPPGEDAFGPLGLDVPLVKWIRSVWSGTVVMEATVRSLTGGDELDLTQSQVCTDLATLYEVAAQRWTAVAAAREGTARLWRDLATRAESTARRLTRSEHDSAGGM